MTASARLKDHAYIDMRDLVIKLRYIYHLEHLLRAERDIAHIKTQQFTTIHNNTQRFQENLLRRTTYFQQLTLAVRMVGTNTLPASFFRRKLRFSENARGSVLIAPSPQ
jgi:hypothetical protein